MAAFHADGVGVDNFPNHGLPARHGVLSCMRAAAAKPTEQGGWRHQWAAQYVMASLAMARGDKGCQDSGSMGEKALQVHDSSILGLDGSQNSTWQSGDQSRVLPVGPQGNLIRWRELSQEEPSNGNTTEVNPRAKGPTPGGAKTLGRAPRDGGGERKRQAKNRAVRRQKFKQSPGEDASGGESRCKPTLDGIASMASSPSWLAKARARFERKFYAHGTWTARSSKRRKVLEIVEACGGRDKPLSVDIISDVAAALDQAQLQSSEQYLSELKWIHIEAGKSWSEGMERRLVLCKRALKRNIGPEKRALEVKIEDIEDEKWFRTGSEKSGPVRTAWSYAWACIWMLRAVEAAEVQASEAAHPEVQEGPGSKGGQQNLTVLWVGRMLQELPLEPGCPGHFKVPQGCRLPAVPEQGRP